MSVTSKDVCQHGMARGGCAACADKVAVTSPTVMPSDPPSSRSKDRLLEDLSDLLGVAHYSATPGSSPARLFEAAAATAKVKPGPMPTVAAAIAAKAGLEWGPHCDNRRHRHEATMVTREGIVVVTKALRILAAR